jgi:hypothetical protein
VILALLILAAFFAVLSLAAWAADRQPPPPRPDRRLSANEMRLTGPDYTVHAQPLMARRERTEQIIREVTGATWTR